GRRRDDPPRALPRDALPPRRGCLQRIGGDVRRPPRCDRLLLQRPGRGCLAVRRGTPPLGRGPGAGPGARPVGRTATWALRGTSADPTSRAAARSAVARCRRVAPAPPPRDRWAPPA